MTARPLAALLGHGGSFEGDLSFEGRVRLDGLFRGCLRTDDALEIGPGGRVEGEVHAAEVRVAGAVDGLLRVSRLLVLEATASVSGELRANRLEVQPGARLRATVTVGPGAGRDNKKGA